MCSYVSSLSWQMCTNVRKGAVVRSTSGLVTRSLLIHSVSIEQFDNRRLHRSRRGKVLPAPVARFVSSQYRGLTRVTANVRRSISNHHEFGPKGKQLDQIASTNVSVILVGSNHFFAQVPQDRLLRNSCRPGGLNQAKISRV